VSEVALGVVAGTMLDAKARIFHPHGDAAEASVLRRIRAVVAKQVVERGVALHLREGFTEVVRVGERRSARIGGERRERLLLRGDLVELVGDAAAGERVHPAAAGLAG